MPDLRDTPYPLAPALEGERGVQVVPSTALGAFGVREAAHQPAPVIDLGALFTAPGAATPDKAAPVHPPTSPAPSAEARAEDWSAPRQIYDVASMFGGSHGQAEPIYLALDAEVPIESPTPTGPVLDTVTVVAASLEPPTPPQKDVATFMSAFGAPPPPADDDETRFDERTDILAITGLDLPRSLRTEQTLDQVFGFDRPEAAALLVAFPHYELGSKESHLVSHLEARLMLADIQKGMEKEAEPVAKDLDQSIARLLADGYLRQVPFRGEAAADLDDIVRANIPERWDGLLVGGKNRAYELTDSGIAAARVLRSWEGQGEVALPDGSKKLQLPLDMPESVPYEAFTAGWQAMARRMEAGLLGPGEMGRYFQGELASVASVLDRSDPSVALGKTESILEGLQTAAVVQIELGYSPDDQAPLRVEDIDAAIRMAEGIVDRIPATVNVETIQEDGTSKREVLSLRRDDVQLVLASLEGTRVSMDEIAGARNAMVRGAILAPERAWRPIQEVPRVHAELSPLAERTAAHVVRAWLNQAAEGLEQGAEIAARNFDAFLDRAFGASAEHWRVVLNARAA